MSESFVYEVYQGEDRIDLPFFIRDATANVYLDMSTATEITMRIRHKTSGLVEFTLSGGEIALVPGQQGKLLLTISDTNSINLRLGLQDIELIVDFGTIRRIAVLAKGINVLKGLS